jgi:hypothetical protein
VTSAPSQAAAGEKASGTPSRNATIQPSVTAASTSAAISRRAVSPVSTNTICAATASGTAATMSMTQWPTPAVAAQRLNTANAKSVVRQNPPRRAALNAMTSAHAVCSDGMPLRGTSAGMANGPTEADTDGSASGYATKRPTTGQTV